MIRACSTEIGCELKSLRLETEKNDLHGALRCVTQREFPCGATKLPDTVVDASAFKSGRHFAAWIGLVPQQNGTGGKVQPRG